MNNDFKKSSYLLTTVFFLIGIAALVCVSAAKYFKFDELVVTVGQIVSLVAFFVMFINCIYSKSKYNNACIRFADYILTNRRKEAERKAADVERMKEMQNIRESAERDSKKAIEAALEHAACCIVYEAGNEDGSFTLTFPVNNTKLTVTDLDFIQKFKSIC